jgi:hypothetical protein
VVYVDGGRITVRYDAADFSPFITTVANLNASVIVAGNGLEHAEYDKGAFVVSSLLKSVKYVYLLNTLNEYLKVLNQVDAEQLDPAVMNGWMPGTIEDPIGYINRGRVSESTGFGMSIAEPYGKLFQVRPAPQEELRVELYGNFFTDQLEETDQHWLMDNALSLLITLALRDLSVTFRDVDVRQYTLSDIPALIQLAVSADYEEDTDREEYSTYSPAVHSGSLRTELGQSVDSIAVGRCAYFIWSNVGAESEFVDVSGAVLDIQLEPHKEGAATDAKASLFSCTRASLTTCKPLRWDSDADGLNDTNQLSFTSVMTEALQEAVAAGWLYVDPDVAPTSGTAEVIVCGR